MEKLNNQTCRVNYDSNYPLGDISNNQVKDILFDEGRNINQLDRIKGMKSITEQRSFSRRCSQSNQVHIRNVKMFKQKKMRITRQWLIS